MGIDIILENEQAQVIGQVDDPRNLLGGLLPGRDDSYHCLRFIDPYGNTIFNRLQMERFLEEWQQIKQNARSQEERQLLDDVEKLARRCASEPHFYLRFRGD